MEQLGSLSEYTYYAMGGPYLEDFRILYELCRGIGMVSVEKDVQIWRRQKFHLPSSNVGLMNVDMFDLIDEYEAGEEKSIFWLDFTNLVFQNFEYFGKLLSKLSEGSVVKVTLRARPVDYMDGAEEFRSEFQTLLPEPNIDPPPFNPEYSMLLQDMLKVASQQGLAADLARVFQPISSFSYSDGTTMLTLTGVVCARSDRQRFIEVFRDWEFANLCWAAPKTIDVPILSVKERLCLQDKLPCDEPTGENLLRSLGYFLGGGKQRTLTQLEQYSDFHRYYPYFIRAVP